MRSLETRGSALAAPDGTVALVIGEPEGIEPLTTLLAVRGYVVVASGTTRLDPRTVEVEGAEVRLLVVLRPDPAAVSPVVRALSAGEAAYVVGSRATALAEVAGGPLDALGRLARRVAAYEVRYAVPRVGAQEVTRLWSSR